jgi:AGZA family xanthine/uracil permease-like MFS transporter
VVQAVNGLFRLSERGSTVRTEVVAGVTTFMTMAYILFVNPAILGTVADRTGTKLAFPQVLTVTALVAGVLTLLMGLVANYPFAIAPGLGLNAVVTFQLVAANRLSWDEAMGVIVTEGIVITVLVLTGFREAVMNAIPMSLKRAIGVGIGLFIALIGFVNAGFVSRVRTAGGPPLELGRGGRLTSAAVAVFVLGFLISALLLARRVKGALLIGIVSTTVLAVVENALYHGSRGRYLWSGPAKLPALSKLIEGPDFSLIGRFSFQYWAALGAVSAVLAVFTIMLADFFDTMGTVVGLGGEAGFLDQAGRLPGIDRVLLVDSLAAAAGGAASSSSATTYIESASGIAAGGRTGLTSVVTGALFLASLGLAPIAGIIPPEATAPALILVGFFMMTIVREIPWDVPEEGIPAFLTMVVMPFTYSITNGIGAGFVVYDAIMLLKGRGREIHWMMHLVALAFVVYFGIALVERVLT